MTVKHLKRRQQHDWDARSVQVVPANLQHIADILKEIDGCHSMTATWNNGQLRTIKIPLYTGTWTYAGWNEYLVHVEGEKGFRLFHSHDDLTRYWMELQ